MGVPSLELNSIVPFAPIKNVLKSLKSISTLVLEIFFTLTSKLKSNPSIPGTFNLNSLLFLELTTFAPSK